MNFSSCESPSSSWVLILIYSMIIMVMRKFQLDLLERCVVVAPIQRFSRNDQRSSVRPRPPAWRVGSCRPTGARRRGGRGRRAGSTERPPRSSRTPPAPSSFGRRPPNRFEPALYRCRAALCRCCSSSRSSGFFSASYFIPAALPDS